MASAASIQFNSREDFDFIDDDNEEGQIINNSPSIDNQPTKQHQIGNFGCHVRSRFTDFYLREQRFDRISKASFQKIVQNRKNLEDEHGKLKHLLHPFIIKSYGWFEGNNPTSQKDKKQNQFFFLHQ